MTLNTPRVGDDWARCDIRGCNGFFLIDVVDTSNWECADGGLVRNRWA